MKSPESITSYEIPEESPEHLFERSELKGARYVSLLHKMTGKIPFDDKEDDEVLSDYYSAGKSYFKKQKDLFNEKSMDAVGLISQISKKLPVEMSNPESYDLDELSPGVFLLKIQDDIYLRIRPTARAAVVKLLNGVSFVIAPITENKERDQTELKENIPHEVHHLLWEGIKEAGLVKTTESNEDLEKAFIMFQDEILARMSSGGHLAGYTHLAMLDPKNREDFKTTNPETYSEIQEFSSSLNNLLELLSNDLKIRDLQGSVLIGTVIDATSFKDLQDNLAKAREHILTLPVTNLPKEFSTNENNSGWGFA